MKTTSKSLRVTKWVMLPTTILLCLSTSYPSFAQARIVSGQVTDDGGALLPGVNVAIKGTNTGTVTDAEGKYSLDIGNANVLIFSFVGMIAREIDVGQSSILDVELRADVQVLSQVVVTGIGVPTEKRKLAFDVETISGDKLPLGPTASVDHALIGKIPGALIMSGNGSPGSDINILLRGINSINSGTSPMILLNGTEIDVTSLKLLDLNSVDRVEVIQGAAAASIYGAQGANGVIQIFTKKGKQGRIQIDLSSSMASNKWLNNGGLAKATLHGFKTDSDNYVIGAATGERLVQDPQTLLYSDNVVWNPRDTALVMDKPYDRNLKYHDHFREFFTTALTTNHNISVSGGSENLDFNLSVSKNHQDSNFKGDGYNDRTNFLSNLGINLSNKLQLRSISQLVLTRNTVSIWNKQKFGGPWLILPMLNARPFVDFWIRDSVGNYGTNYGNAVGAMFNPNYEFQYAATKETQINILQSFDLTYAPFRFLNFDLKYGINHQDETVRYSAANQTENANSISMNRWAGWKASDSGGEVSTFENTLASQNFLARATVRIDFAKELGLRFPLKSISQMAYDYRSKTAHDYNTYGLGIPLHPPLTANQATTFRIEQDFTMDFITYGYLLNQRLEWGEIAGISGGFRSDYSSAFGSGYKPFTFPRGDAFVRLSSMDFWKALAISRVILDWKLRGAYGKAGIQPQPFDRFPTLSTSILGNTNSYFVGAYQSNPDLNVEVSEEIEMGTDIIFEKLSSHWLGQIALSFTYWKRNTDNAIITIDTPSSSGVGTELDNAFSLKANGIQSSLTATLFQNSNLAWNITANFGKQTSRVESIKGGREIVVGDFVLRPGDRVGQLLGYLLLHDVNATDPSTGLPFISPESASNYQVAGNGWVVDKRTKTPFITSKKYALGDPFPDFNASFINDFTFKKFLSFGFQVDWVHGGHILNLTKISLYRDGVHSDYTKSFEINGRTGAWSAFYNGVWAGVSSSGYDVKNYFYEDGSFVRVRNLYAGIDFAQWTPGLRKLQLVFSGRNVITWTKYTGMDPESSSTSLTNGVLYQRGDMGTLPNARTYQVTLNIGI